MNTGINLSAWMTGIIVGLALTATLAAEPPPQEQAKQLMSDPLKGNCLACHKVAGGVFPGNIGPALQNIRQLFPDRAALYAQIYDPTVINPLTVMPPFGRHGILTEKEINLIVDYLITL